jgi:predicted GIY-YIG superfamily endonuclease
MPVLEEQRQLMPEWFVYILRSQTRRFIYVGSTRDLRRRLDEHNAGLVQSTKAYRPLAIVAYIAVQGEQKARELERYFKTGSGKAILKKRILTDEALLFGA